MLVSSIEIVNPFPNEKIRIKAPKTLPTINSIRFDSVFKRLNSSNQLNSNSNILTSVPFPTYNLNPDEHALTFSYPKRFPLDWNVVTNNDMFFEAEIVNSFGVTGVTVFPTHPFPKLISYNDNSLTLSSVLLSAQYFNESSVNLDWNGYDITYDLLLNSPDKIFDDLSTFMYMPSAYFGASRVNEVFTTINHEVTTLSADFSDKILANSFEIVVPIVNADPSKSPIGYTGESIYTIYDPLRNGTLVGRKRSDLLANPINANIDYSTGVFGLDYNHGYFVSSGDATVSYRTSSIPTLTLSAYTSTNTNIPLPGNLGTDYFILSSALPIYYYNVPLTFQGTAYAANKGATLYWNLDTSVNANGTSSVAISCGMVDNYKQGWWDLKNSGTLAMLHYENVTDNENLSGFANGDYVSPMQQVPASSDFVFRNDGAFQTYTVNLVLSTFSNSVQKSSEKFSMNHDQANFTINLTSLSSSFVAEIETDAIIDETYPVKWNVNLSDNIELYSAINGERIQLNTLVNYTTAYSITGRNLGFEPTQIIFYNSEYGVSSTQVWNPIQSSYTNAKLEISGTYVDAYEIPKGTLNAYLKRGNLVYRVPDNSFVKWNILTDNDVVIDGHGANSRIFFDQNYYNGNNARSISYTITADCVESNPQNIGTIFNAEMFNDMVSLTSVNSYLLDSIQKSCTNNIWFVLSANDQIYNSSDECSTAVISTGTHFFDLSANLSTINADASSVFWFVNNSLVASGHTLTGVEISSMTNVTSCITISALMASANSGGFPLQNYSDSFCFCLRDQLTPFDFLIYPTTQWNGTTFENVTSYTSSNGPSAYGNCHEQCFTISASPGFDEYICQIGEQISVFKTSVFDVCKSVDTVGVIPISITAYDSCYKNSCEATGYNSSSSVSGDVIRDLLNFNDYEIPVNNFTINDTVFNLNSAFNETLVELTASMGYGTSPVKMVSANLTLSLTDIEGRIKTSNVQLIGNDNILQNYWTLEDINSMFYLEENTVGEFVLDVTGTLTQIIPGHDYCPQTITFPTASFNVTALHGPEIGLYTEKNCLSTNESFVVKNQSKIIDNQFGLSTIYIDFGDNRVSAISADQRTLTHSYSANGSYTWTLTGELRNGLKNIVTLVDYLEVSTPQIDPVQEIQRNFPSHIDLPYNRIEISDFSNDWAIAQNFNTKVDRISANFEYIKQQSYIYNPLLPMKYLGWYGNNKTAILKWNNSEYADQNQQEFTNISDIIQDSGNLFVIDDNRLKIYENGYYPRLIVDKNRIGEDENWNELKSIQFNNNIIACLDKGNNAIYFYKWTGGYQTKLLYYFGGWGNVSSKYKFNKPNDFSYRRKQILVCDTDNKSIKQYDSSFSWISTQTYEVKPLSVDVNDQGIFVLFEDGTVYFCDSNFNVISSWKFEGQITPNTKLRVNDQFVYINSDELYKYTLKGSLVGLFKKELTNRKVSGISFSDGIVYICEKTIIHKVCDNDSYLSVRDISTDVNLINFDDVKLDSQEFLTVDVYNDSLSKIFFNQKTLVDSFSAKFYEILSPCDDQFIDFETRAFTNTTPLVSALIGYNECINYPTIGREFNLISDNFDLLTNILKSETVYPVFSAECLTWAELSMPHEHCANGGDHKPLSWYELIHGMECPETGDCLNEYMTYFGEITTTFTHFQIPYSVDACNYVTTNFTNVTCNSAIGLIFFDHNQ